MESKRRDSDYLQEILRAKYKTSDFDSYKEAQEQENEEEARRTQLAGMVFLALISILLFAIGAITCYLIYGSRH
jgi:hypothetical protein